MKGENEGSAADQNSAIRDFDLSLPMQLLRAREAAMARFRPMLRSHGLTEQQWRVIRVLAAYPNIDTSELAKQSLLLAPSLTRILQTLESEQLVARISDKNDQRRFLFTLTRDGRRCFAKVAPDSERLYNDITNAFGGERLNHLYVLLDEFSTALAE